MKSILNSLEELIFLSIKVLCTKKSTLSTKTVKMMEFSINVAIYNLPSKFSGNKAHISKVQCTEFTVTEVVGQQESTPLHNVPFPSGKKG